MEWPIFNRASRVLDMIRNWRELERLYDDMMYRPPRDPMQLFEIGDRVKKVTGDYHVTGYVVSAFRTRLLLKLRYVVEISAEGGGSFCHIFAPSNLELIEKRLLASPDEIVSDAGFRRLSRPQPPMTGSAVKPPPHARGSPKPSII